MFVFAAGIDVGALHALGSVEAVRQQATEGAVYLSFYFFAADDSHRLLCLHPVAYGVYAVKHALGRSVHYALGAASGAGAYLFARSAGDKLVRLIELENAGRRAAILGTPLCPGNMLAVYSDPDFLGRVTVYSMPKSDEVYYVTERVEGDEAVKAYTSEFFPSLQKLEPLLRELDDITEQFCSGESA